MYRIRLASGEEAVYRTVQELAQAVASGMVSPDAEVYHKAANKWLPINTHPDYRAAMVTGQQTAINPAIKIPGTPAKGSPAIEIPPAASASPPSGKNPAVTGSGKNPALAVGPIPGNRPSSPNVPADPAPPRKSTVKTTAVPTDLDFDLIDPEPEPPKAATRQSAAIPVPATANTAKASAIQVPSTLPAEAEMVDLTAPEPPIMTEAPAVEPLFPAPPRPSFFDRNRLVLISSIAALVLAVGVTGLVLVKSAPRGPVEPDSSAISAGAIPPDTARADTVVATAPTPPPAKPVAAPAATSPVRTARPSAVVDSFPAPSRPTPIAAAPPRKDSTPPKAAVPPPAAPKPKPASSRTPSYFQAYADARAEMDASLAYVNFRRVFSPGRFSSPDSLRATKRMIVAAGNILRVYRGREVMLEQQYRPDDPGGRNSLREPFETSEASRALLSDVDSLFTLLVNQDEVTVTEREIRFRNARTAKAYNDIRRQIAQTLSAWRDSAEAQNRVTMPRLVQALGTTLPPPAR